MSESSTAPLEVEVAAVPRFFPGKTAPGASASSGSSASESSGGSGQPPTLSRLYHGDLHMPPGVFGTFNDATGTMDAERRAEWMRQCQPEAPQSDPQKPDIQGWTYIADYTIHPLTPTHSGPLHYYIHARIRHDNRLEFGAFAEPCQGSSRRQYPLTRISGSGNARPTLTPCLHGDLTPALRIAGKAEAEAKLLHNGKLIQSAAPKLIGALMNVGNARIALSYGDSTTYLLKTYYGHIWVYWGAIIDNILYIAGIPAYTGQDRGTIVCSSTEDGRGTRRPVSLPPTEDDLRTQFGGSVLVSALSTVPLQRNDFHQAVERVWGISSSPIGGFESSDVNVERFLESYGDTTTPTVLCTRALARVQTDSGTPTLTRLYHGDVYTDSTLLGYSGGVYATPRGLLIRNIRDVTTSFVYPETGGGWPSSSGASGFITTKTRYDRLGHVRYAAQAFVAGHVGRHYYIKTVGCLHPYGAYDENSILSGVDAHLSRSKAPDPSDQEDEPSWGGGGGGGGGGSGADDDDDPSDWPPTRPTLDSGIYLKEGSGVSIQATQDIRRDSEGNVRDIIYTFTLSIAPQKFTAQTAYTATLNLSTSNGGSYTAFGKSCTMYYGFSAASYRGASATVTYKSSYMYGDSDPKSATVQVRLNGKLTVTARASRGSATSKQLPTSNILNFSATGGRRRVCTGGVTKDFTIYTVSLNTAKLRGIALNAAYRAVSSAQATVIPPSVSGSNSGEPSGGPSVSAAVQTLTPTHTNPYTSYATTVTGCLPVTITGIHEASGSASASISGSAGWTYDEGNSRLRGSGSISGSFSVRLNTKSF